MLCQEDRKVNLKRIYRQSRSKGYGDEAHKNKKVVSGSGDKARNRRMARFWA